MEFPTLTEEEEKALLTQPTEGVEEEKPAEDVGEKPIEEPAPEKPAEEEKPVEEEKPAEEAPKAPDAPEDNSAAARYRFEAAEAKRKLAEREAEIEALRNPKKTLPAKEENYEAHVEGRLETSEERLARLEAAEAERQKEQREQQTVVGALTELKQYESAYAQAAPDYQEASNHLKSMIATSIKLLEPNLSPEELAKRTIKTFLERAGTALNSGVNPAQSIYNQALQVGYRRQEKKEETASKERGNFEKVAENKKKSPGMIGTGSGSKPATTLEAMDKMSNRELEEFSRLNPEETERLMYG